MSNVVISPHTARRLLDALTAVALRKGISKINPTASGAKEPEPDEAGSVTTRWLATKDPEVKLAMVASGIVVGVLYIKNGRFECVGGITNIVEPTIGARYFGGNSTDSLDTINVTAIVKEDITKMLLAPVMESYAKKLKLAYLPHDLRTNCGEREGAVAFDFGEGRTIENFFQEGDFENNKPVLAAVPAVVAYRWNSAPVEGPLDANWEPVSAMDGGGPPHGVDLSGLLDAYKSITDNNGLSFIKHSEDNDSPGGPYSALHGSELWEVTSCNPDNHIKVSTDNRRIRNRGKSAQALTLRMEKLQCSFAEKYIMENWEDLQEIFGFTEDKLCNNKRRCGTRKTLYTAKASGSESDSDKDERPSKRKKKKELSTPDKVAVSRWKLLLSSSNGKTYKLGTLATVLEEYIHDRKSLTPELWGQHRQLIKETLEDSDSIIFNGVKLPYMSALFLNKYALGKFSQKDPFDEEPDRILFACWTPQNSKKRKEPEQNIADAQADIDIG